MNNLDNPYVGPRTFTRAESDRFFGRETEARELLALVISERLVLFYAQSGAGKSSLINTRLAPRLAAEGFLVLPIARVGRELPEGVTEVNNIFIFNLLLSLEQSQQDPNRFAHMTLPHFLANLTSTDGEHFYYDDSPPDAAVDDLAADETYEEPPHVLIIDQFEEILTTHLERWPERSDFFRQLDQAMRDDPLLWVVLTLREDHLAALDPYASLLANRLSDRYYMQRMGYEAALEAIQCPAELAGRPFTPAAAQTLADNLRQIKGGEALGQFIEPVQLQVVCYQLWENLKDQPGDAITKQDLQESGDVDTALAEFYAQALRQTLAQSGVSEIELRNWFDQQLITEAGTRGTVFQGVNETAGLPNPVVKLLADQFLLRSEIRAGGAWYELVHDRFVEPILQANRTWWLRQSPLIRAAQAWKDSGWNKSKLYLGQQLKEALASLGQSKPEPLVAEFLAASKAENQVLEEKEAMRQRELVQEGRRRLLMQTRYQQARNLHDGPYQFIHAIAMRLNYIQKHKAYDEIAKVEEIAQHSIQEIRVILQAMRPDLLKKQGLVPTLKEYAEVVCHNQPFNITVTNQGYDGQLTEVAEEVVFSVVQETLGNAKRHAQATEIRISLIVKQDELSVEIKDNGVGFDVESVRSTTGLDPISIMNDRTQLVGGHCIVDSAPGKGTTIFVKIPFDQASEGIA